MNRIKMLFFTIVIIACMTSAFALASEPDMATTLIPTPGMVTMVDLGADKCIPCKMMAPIIEELKAEYEGVAAIVFIDVWKNPSEAKKYGIKAIPTQIFYDKDGKEVERHMGFFDKKSILAIFEKLDVTKESEQ